VPAGAVGVVTADCNPGEVATGGGGFLDNAFNKPAEVRSYPSALGSETSLSSGVVPQAWTTRIVNTDTNANALNGYVVCASM
jgi:hypothetical protein